MWMKLNFTTAFQYENESSIGAVFRMLSLYNHLALLAFVIARYSTNMLNDMLRVFFSFHLSFTLPCVHFFLHALPHRSTSKNVQLEAVCCLIYTAVKKD